MQDNQQNGAPAPVQPPVVPPATPGTAPVAPNAGPGGLAIAALVLGILAFLSGWIAVLGLLLGIAAIVLGIMAMKKPAGKTFGIIGLIGGILGALTGLVMTVFFVIGLVAASSIQDTAQKQLDRAQQEMQEEQKKADAKSDFSKGETGVFGDWEVKVNSVQRNYDTGSKYYVPKDGNEYIVVNITAKNVSKSPDLVSSYDFKVNVDGASEGPSYATVPSPKFDSKTLDPGVSQTGNILFEVPKGATNLKLTMSAYTVNGQKTYTLAF